MKTTDFSFDLPNELIAQHPSSERGGSRLMHLPRTTGDPSHHKVSDLPELLRPGSLLVFNQSRVRKARLYAEEREYLLLERVRSGPEQWEAMTKKASRLRIGQSITFPANAIGTVTSIHDGRVVLQFEAALSEEYFESHGHVPLPPYINREDEEEDEDRYQTVYASEYGSVAAPTAGLHFTESLLQRLDARGIESAWVTLHVGMGTFLPVRTDDPDKHVMHSERCVVSEETASQINNALSDGRDVVAVGTTSVRTLESAAERGRVRPFSGSTDIFIKPGFEFQVISGLFTNFHTPQSTLVMLVSALAGRTRILDAYVLAVSKRYRFFSYGDAMLIL